MAIDCALIIINGYRVLSEPDAQTYTVPFQFQLGAELYLRSYEFLGESRNSKHFTALESPLTLR